MSPASAFRDPDAIPVSKLPEPLRDRAKSWRQAAGGWARVAARTDDAGEWRIVLLRSDELCWVGWSMVNWNA